MPSWKIHEKWCEILGISREVCKEINKIIDLPPHDIVKKLLRWGWAREAFEKGMIKETFRIKKGDEYDKLFSELAEITNKYGGEGIRATFCHIALDKIAELIKMGLKKDDIEQKLNKENLMGYIYDFNAVYNDISKEINPSSNKIQRRIEFNNTVRSGVKGIIRIDFDKPLSAPAALIRLKSLLNKGKKVHVKWQDTFSNPRNTYYDELSNEKDLNKFTKKIKEFKP
ncbi:MAG: hypothetical protein ACP6IY_20990 [Promethearchaeia archaeon]